MRVRSRPSAVYDPLAFLVFLMLADPVIAGITAPSTPATAAEHEKLTPVRFEHSRQFVPLLERLGGSLLISTYQAGKVISVGTHGGGLDIRFHHFDQAMGLARTPKGIAVGAKRQIWFLSGAPELAPKIAPAGKHDLALLTRQAHYTGPVMGHEMAWSNDELWFVNTLFSSLCVVSPEFHFVPKWMPPFVSKLAAEDRCHLNGLALADGKPRYVTALGETDSAAGWRPGKASGGCLIDVDANEVVLRGLCMPHSPRLHQGEVLLLNSGRGQLCSWERGSAEPTPIVSLPGYTRGMDCVANLAFVGLSRIRETNVFGGLPIAERHHELKCGVAVVDLKARETIASLHFDCGVEEIFEVKLLPGYRTPILSGPLPDVDESEPLWLVPPLPAGRRT